LKDWITLHAPDLLRAFTEGYEVDKGVADRLIALVERSLPYQFSRSWDAYEERTSPWASSFAKRDRVKEEVRRIALPKDWSLEVSRIYRIQQANDKYTGVFVTVRNASLRNLVSTAANFETHT